MDLYEQTAPEREQVAYFMRRLYNRGLTTSSGGNLSLRVGDSHVLLTPSALDKGELVADQVLLATLDGENLSPHLKPTIETSMHLAVLRARPDIRAVVHAHPAFATSFACVDRELDTALTSEIYMHVPKIGCAPFATPGTDALGHVVAGALADVDVALMRNHGVIAVGQTMFKAFDLLESTESFARTSFIAHLISDPSHPVLTISAPELRAIDLVCGRK
jgi:L-fuculose-phosphate aldolase